MKARKTVDYSVVIPGYNSRKTLAWCLEGVMEQGAERALEVIVVESGDGGYLCGLAETYPGVSFVLAPRRLFSGQARNVGAKLAKGETIIFLDSDCRPLPGWIEAIGRCHEKGCNVVCGALENGTPESAVGTAEYLVTHSTFSPRMPPSEILESTAATGNLSIRKSTWDATGGFAGTFRTVDYILTRRLLDSGETIMFWPEARVLHVNCTEPGGYVRGQVERGKWSARTRRKHGTQGSIAVKVPPLAFLLFPLRLCRLMMRSALYRPLDAAAFLKVLPFAVLGLAAWTWGYFLAGLDTGGRGYDERDPLPAGWEEFDVLQGGARGKVESHSG